MSRVSVCTGPNPRREPQRVAPVRLCSATLTALLMALPVMAHAFGTMGHRIAEEVAAPLLCAQTTAAVRRLAAGEPLVGLGAWADRIRDEPQWEHTAVWHYINVPDIAPIPAWSNTRSGNVLWAVNYFSSALADERLPAATRAQALKFLVHFVVDVHQPLHVGRAADRGGNTVALVIDGESTNLHRLWDTGILERRSSDVNVHVAAARALIDAAQAWLRATPRDWAEESRSLRAFIYDFDGVPDKRYFEEAGNVLDRRLAQAGVRLAGELNRIFCGA